MLLNYNHNLIHMLYSLCWSHNLCNGLNKHNIYFRHYSGNKYQSKMYNYQAKSRNYSLWDKGMQYNQLGFFSIRYM